MDSNAIYEGADYSGLSLMKGRFLSFSPNVCASARGPEDAVTGPKQFVLTITRNLQIVFFQPYT